VLDGRVIAVRVQPSARIADADYALNENLTTLATANHLNMFLGSLHGLDVLGQQRGGREIRDLHPDGKIAACSHFVVEIHIFKVPREKVASRGGCASAHFDWPISFPTRRARSFFRAGHRGAPPRTRSTIWWPFCQRAVGRPLRIFENDRSVLRMGVSRVIPAGAKALLEFAQYV